MKNLMTCRLPVHPGMFVRAQSVRHGLSVLVMPRIKMRPKVLHPVCIDHGTTLLDHVGKQPVCSLWGHED